MTERLKSYAPNQVDVIITHAATGTSHIVNGFSEDSIVQIERGADTWTLYRGADDTKTRIYNADTSGTITIPLQQTSSSNDVLTSLYDYDRARLNSDGLFSIQIKDRTGRSIYFSDEAYIGVVPGSNFSNTMETRDWVIHAASLTTIIGGNGKLSGADAATLAALGVTIEDKWL